MIKYDVLNIQGFTVCIEAGLTKTYERLLPEIRDDLEEIARVLPTEALRIARTTRIYFNESLCYGKKCDPVRGRGMCHHPSAAWLVAHGNLPSKEGCIECYNVRDYFSWREQQPAMLLHELSHHYHFCMGEAADRLVRPAFRHAKASGKYDRVGYCGSREKNSKHYAMTNMREYFAECSEAYFSSERFRNDYEPYTRSELKAFDPNGFEMCERVWALAKTVKPTRRAAPFASS